MAMMSQPEISENALSYLSALSMLLQGSPECSLPIILENPGKLLCSDKALYHSRCFIPFSSSARAVQCDSDSEQRLDLLGSSLESCCWRCLTTDSRLESKLDRVRNLGVVWSISARFGN